MEKVIGVCSHNLGWFWRVVTSLLLSVDSLCHLYQVSLNNTHPPCLRRETRVTKGHLVAVHTDSSPPGMAEPLGIMGGDIRGEWLGDWNLSPPSVILAVDGASDLLLLWRNILNHGQVAPWVGGMCPCLSHWPLTFWWCDVENIATGRTTGIFHHLIVLDLSEEKAGTRGRKSSY